MNGRVAQVGRGRLRPGIGDKADRTLLRLGTGEEIDRIRPRPGIGDKADRTLLRLGTGEEIDRIRPRLDIAGGDPTAVSGTRSSKGYNIMRIEELRRENVPETVLRIWTQHYGPTLLPVQERAVRHGLLGTAAGDDRPQHLIITAPTSSGKSFCAEMAALAAICRRQQVLWLLPLKSLAEQVYHDLKTRYRELGLSLLLVTGDHPENDRAFHRGDFQLAVAIYEKADLLLTAELDRLATLGTIIVDELQMLFQPGRGPVLERLLTKIRLSRYRPRLIGLSAVLEEPAAAALSEWLAATRLEERIRPVDLYRGVAVDGTFHYRSHNSGVDGEEPFATAEAGEDQVEAFLLQLRRAEGSTLVFVKSRQDTLSLAFRLAGQTGWPPAKTAIASLTSGEKSFLNRSLIQAMNHGVAFHNADLTSDQRKIVEQAFVDKQVRVLISTTTLAMGVNLPADNVYLETVKYVAGEYDGRPSLVPLARAEFENMAGRAGRLGHHRQPVGRAVVLADSPFDHDILWENYIAPLSADRTCLMLPNRTAEDWLLNLLTAGLIRTPADLAQAHTGSFGAHLHPDKPVAWETALDRLITTGMVTVIETSQLVVSPLGRAVALSGLSVRAGEEYARKLQSHGYPESSGGWLALALSGVDWELSPGLLSGVEFRAQEPLQALYRRFDHALGELAYLLPENHRQVPLRFDQAARLKAFMVLDEWSRLAPVNRLEERYQIHLGQIQHLANQASHLVRALGLLVEATDRLSPVIRTLHDLAFSLRRGLPPSYRSLARALGDLLRRSDYLALRTAGIETVAEFCELGETDRETLLEGNGKIKQINVKVQSLKVEVDMKQLVAHNLSTAAAEPELVEIDGSQDRERYVIKINGLPVKLTGKSFKYFTKLAWSRRHAESGWLYKEDIEAGFNQARYLYRMKNEITASLAADWSVVENNRLGYYRLDLDPERIQFNFDNLKSHPDWEIRSLFERSGGGADLAH